MSDTRELKDLLDRLKGEVGPLPQAQPERGWGEAAQFGEQPPAAAPAQQALRSAAGRTDRYAARPYRAQEQPASSGGPENLVWSENKESMLFGMLASLTAALGGILAGLDYLVLTGAVFFSFFSMVTLLALFRFSLNSRRAVVEAAGLADRVDALSRKVEMLSSRAASGDGVSVSAASPDRERELEQKVEELRVLVKTLAKAVNGGDK
ncbi:MAG: hypothetical protein Q7R35_19165 [Elusimicrobiota bacterium]|nr:hypothetical protein [Elusimicrobiota bacterium]